MTSMDANALANDPIGLAFLASVLDTQAASGSQNAAFDLGAQRHGWTIMGGDIDMSRPALDERLTEAA